MGTPNKPESLGETFARVKASADAACSNVLIPPSGRDAIGALVALAGQLVAEVEALKAAKPRR